MFLADCHVHSSFSSDSETPVEAIVAQFFLDNTQHNRDLAHAPDGKSQ